jgi:PAS domain-containing protein
MNKKLGRFLHSHVWIYFVMMLGFAVASFMLRQYILAGVELLLTVVAVFIYVTHKRHRHWEVQQFLSKLNDSQIGVKGAESPFPTAVIRLPSGQILFGNESFSAISGYHDGMTERMIDEVMEPCDTEWRGLGVIPQSGLRLRDEYAAYDARRKFGIPEMKGRSNPACRCGDVLRGILAPDECPLFRKACNPENPLGPCMVSSEGTCSAYYRYFS